MEITGTITHVLDIRSGVGSSTGKEWKMQTIVINDGAEQYPKDVALDVAGDYCGKLNVGDKIKALADVSSREYQGRWYTSVKAWKVEVLEKASGVSGESASDLPF